MCDLFMILWVEGAGTPIGISGSSCTAGMSIGSSCSASLAMFLVLRVSASSLCLAVYMYCMGGVMYCWVFLGGGIVVFRERMVRCATNK